MRTIKKYPNRRLYDTEASRYITLVDVREMVLKGVEFEVVNANSTEDITRSILLQIIMEQETNGKHLFTCDMLSKFIRFYREDTRDVFSNYLEKTTSFFFEQQILLQKRFIESIASNPFDSLTELTSKNMELWQDMQKQFLAGVGFGHVKKSSKE
ncbi:MAG: polyhydroxyalkanoate synthesis repressor PhaR [Methylococcales bacterium]